jgi:hypothetical protein
MKRKNKKHTLVLSVAHNIYLTRDERYALVEGKPIEVIGVSLPVWLSAKYAFKPVEEVFCKYSIYNNPNEPPATVSFINEGYRINLPQIPEMWSPPIPLTDEMWLKMSDKDLSMWYKTHETPKNASNLRDIEDGGAEYLRFKYLGERDEIQVMHHCEIKKIEDLIEAII